MLVDQWINLHQLDFLHFTHSLRVFLLVDKRLDRTLTINAVTLVPTGRIAGIRVASSGGFLRFISLLFMFRTFFYLLLHLLRFFFLQSFFSP